MLTGKLPYGTQVAKTRTRVEQRTLKYISALHVDRSIPVWIDGAIRKAAHPDPNKRYEDLSEFVFDLRHPNKAFLNQTGSPLMERNPVAFWKGVSLILALVIVIILGLAACPRFRPQVKRGNVYFTVADSTGGCNTLEAA